MALAILFFLTPLSMGNVWNVVSTHDRYRLVDHTSEPRPRPVVMGYNLEQSGDNVLAQDATPRLIDVVTVFTNLTGTVYLIAESNNSLLNVKDHFWIKTHKACDILGIGQLESGYLFTGRLGSFGNWVNLTSGGYFYSVYMRFISSAADIDDIIDEVIIVFEDVQMATAVNWLVQGLGGGIVAMIVIGRWRMTTL